MSIFDSAAFHNIKITKLLIFLMPSSMNKFMCAFHEQPAKQKIKIKNCQKNLIS